MGYVKRKIEIETYYKEPVREEDCSCWIGLRKVPFKWMNIFIRKKYERITHLQCPIHNEVAKRYKKVADEAEMEERVFYKDW